MRTLAPIALSLALSGCFADHGASAGVPCPSEVCPLGRTCQICSDSFRCVPRDELTGCEPGGLPFGLQLDCDGDEDCAGGERCVGYVADLSEGMRCSAFECECAEAVRSRATTTPTATDAARVCRISAKTSPAAPALDSHEPGTGRARARARASA